MNTPIAQFTLKSCGFAGLSFLMHDLGLVSKKIAVCASLIFPIWTILTPTVHSLEQGVVDEIIHPITKAAAVLGVGGMLTAGAYYYFKKPKK